MELEDIKACAVCLSNSLIDVDPDNRIRRCRDCGYVFDAPRPSAAEIISFYSRDNQYDSWLEGLESRDRLWQRRVAKLHRWRKAGSLLDVGTGIGQFLHHARPFFDEVLGTEVSTRAIELGRELYGLEIVQGSVENFPGDLQFDNITMFHVLEHVPNPRQALSRCAQLLRPGGILFLAVPNDVESAKQRTKIRLGKLGVRRYASQGRVALPQIILDGTASEIHLSHFTSATLTRLLAETGFSVCETSLDPYSLARGKARFADAFLRVTCGGILRVTKHNLYDTIWMVGRRIEPEAVASGSTDSLGGRLPVGTDSPHL